MSEPTPSVVSPEGAYSVRIQEDAFDLGLEVARLRGWPGVARAGGAVATFTGYVRSADEAAPAGDAEVLAMTLEHYPGMTERAIAAMIDEAARRFPLLAARVVHRVGRLLPGEPIVLVATASPHRRAAFESCEFLMDYLKTQAPFWKKESTPAGEAWVDARVADDAALARWGVLARANAGPVEEAGASATITASPPAGPARGPAGDA